MNAGIPVYSVDQIRAAEDAAFAVTAPGELMQRASFALAVGCAGLLQETYGRIYGTTAVVVVGPGNNGGDALYAGAYLAQRGVKVYAHCVVPGVCHEQALQAFISAGGVVGECLGGDFDIAIDGIAGLGGGKPVQTQLAYWINTQPLVVSVDIPSGVNADSGACAADQCVHADVTFTFGALKLGLVSTPGAEFAGDIELVDIGLDEFLLDSPSAWVLDEPAASELFGELSFDSYKYSRGVVAVAAGSRQYPGALRLCVLGAQHTGVGMVMVREVGDFDSGITSEFPQVVLGESERVRAWGIGPGFTGSDAERELVLRVLASGLPVVLDAGALTLVAGDADIRALIKSRNAVTVVTPHVGEFRALFPELGEPTLESVRASAANSGAIVVAKGARTIMCAPSGECFIDIEGTPELGTAGSGDVLTGILAGVLASHLADDPLAVVAMGVWMHGRAGRIATLSTPVPTAVDIGLACAEVFDQ